MEGKRERKRKKNVYTFLPRHSDSNRSCGGQLRTYKVLGQLNSNTTVVLHSCQQPLDFFNCRVQRNQDILPQRRQGLRVIEIFTHHWFQVANAEKHGAVGALVYADPSFSAQQGYEASQVYPKGWWLPPSGIQEGSILFSSYVGDPLTPVLPSTKGMYRRRENESMLPKIPAQPISYEAAMELLQRLGGILRYHCYFTFSFLFYQIIVLRSI